jgi:hypothetical protein
MIGDPKKVAIGIIAKLHTKDGDEAPPQDMDDHGGEKNAIAQELIHCVHAGDAAGVVEAFEALFQCLEQEPHDEYSHGNEEEDESGMES